ncbi:MAG: ABC transporter permease [Pseudohongiella sp.]|nr:ABC transporter permease [Pseudohongiella sp.]
MILSKSDLRYTLRQLAKAPGFALLAIVVLAGGLGISLFTLSFLYTMALKPVDLPHGDRIVEICGQSRSGTCTAFKAFEFAAIREDINSLENIGIYNMKYQVWVQSDEVFYQAMVAQTEWNMLGLAGNGALLGRILQEADQHPQAEPVAVLAHDFWQLAFEGEPEIVGSYIALGGEPTLVVGIMPPGFTFPRWSDIWVPAKANLLNPIVNDMTMITPFAYRKAGVSTAEANQEISNLMFRMRQQYPFVDDDSYTQTERMISTVSAGFVTSLPMRIFYNTGNQIFFGVMVILAFMLFVLACINIGTLLLARTNERLKDISIRVALGAPRKRLLIQTMGESIVIAILGTLLAVMMTGLWLEVLNIFLTTVLGEEGLEFWMVFQVEGFTLAMALLFAVLTVLITSALPSWRLINGNFNSVMQDGTRGALGLSTGRFSRSLVVVAVTLISIVLYVFIMFGTVMWSMGNTFRLVNPDGIFSSEIETRDLYANAAERLQFFQALESRLEQHPDVSEVLIAGMSGSQTVEVEGVTYLTEQDMPTAPIQIISGDVGILGARLLEGRLLDERDNQNSAPVAVVSRALAQKLWPDQSPIGQNLRVGMSDQRGQRRAFVVVGMVSDSPIDGDDMYKQEFDMVYLPLGQMDSLDITAIIRSQSSDRAAAKILGDTVLGLNSGVEFSIRSWVQDRQMTSFVILATIGVFSAIGVFAFLVSIAGVFGLTKNSIVLRTQEIGTRRALGASDSRISRSFMLHGARQTLLGIFIAFLICAPLSYIIASTAGANYIMPGLLTSFIGLLVFLVAVLCAIHVPIKSLLRKEPSELLRYQ